MSQFLEDFKKYLAETPREQIEADWKATEKYDQVGIPVDEFIELNKGYKFTKELPPQFKHEFRSIPYEEIIDNRSSAYAFIDFNNSPYREETNQEENNKAC